MDTLKEFSFGFADGEERYSPETPDDYEAVRWWKGEYVILVIRVKIDKYQLLYSDIVGENGTDYTNAQATKQTGFLPFDPLLFKCIANEWCGIPAEVT